ncbi:alpha/beta-type small acid-soluble spore protein [Oceanobacillus profundus]|uniref:alpha/beta-type small acid-soluble spore protein n=1 Tax=Oceanobacillus TaxID=182709 RepID=UPI0026E2B990|nr:alpha/beta-type small acid-soluble spore protein [Oceanobacillus profundus]MDO6450447.1 alpha/beta-type small acid-soluble spore protein [Oceanobacillus profundus]
MAKKNLSQFKGRVMKAKGYNVDNNNADDVKFEVAKEQGIALEKRDNGDLTSRQAGKVGGPIGGNMVKEMINIAKEQMKK